MSWTDLGYGLALTITVGTVLAVLLQWRDARARRAAAARVRQVESPRTRRSARHLPQNLDRAA